MKSYNFLFRKVIHHVGNILRYLQMLYLKSAGVTIGKNTMISFRAKIDVRRGEVIVGDNCTITYGCVILSHDGSAKQINPQKDGKGKVIIGNNVFIGVNTVVLPNVTIGNNTVIGAGSVVTKDLPEGVVALGNPAIATSEIKWLKA